MPTAPILCKALGWAMEIQKRMRSILALQTLTAKSRSLQLHRVHIRGLGSRLVGAGVGSQR